MPRLRAYAQIQRRFWCCARGWYRGDAGCKFWKRTVQELATLFEEIGEGIRKSNTQQGKKNSLSERDGSIYFKRKENSGMNRTLPIWCDTIKYKQSSFLMTFPTSRVDRNWGRSLDWVRLTSSAGSECIAANTLGI